ncbi:choline transporter-like protein 5-A isoform X1 [Lates japonicus]|uniref:Choline transporter-like protein 5-A isoform X1 n=1 Tax=Lates japonicus TaxID=270547 RepID=A0AAD3RJJ2_LATJO|nr:choline transporter-like protein 5-A isoform X1 [Lates japonicus]
MAPHRYIPSSSAAVQGERAAGAATPGLYYAASLVSLYQSVRDKQPWIDLTQPNPRDFMVPTLTLDSFGSDLFWSARPGDEQWLTGSS